MSFHDCAFLFFFFFNDTATTEIYTLSLHDALPIYLQAPRLLLGRRRIAQLRERDPHLGGPAERIDHRLDLPHREVKTRSEEHTSELQSQSNLVCRLLLEKKKRQLLHRRLPYPVYPQ